MAIHYQATRTDPHTGVETTVYVEAVDTRFARAALRRHGWAESVELRPVPPGFGIPGDATVLLAPKPRPAADPGAAVAGGLSGGLFNRLTLRIAVGVCLGMLMYNAVLLLVGAVLSVLSRAFGG